MKRRESLRPDKKDRRAIPDDVSEEIAFHLEGRAAELVDAGWTHAEARAEAKRRFGDVAGFAAQCRSFDHERVQQERRMEILETLRQDVRYALRTLRRNPGFALLAILTLALGIGATTAIFSVVDAVVFRALPFKDSDRLVMVYETNLAKGIDKDPPSPPNFLDWQSAAPPSVADMMAWQDHAVTLTGVARPEVLSGVGVTANFFSLLGTNLQLGRGFQKGEDAPGVARVAVLSHGLWQQMFGGDPHIVGQVITLDGTPVEVVGVTSAGFAIPRTDVDVWYPADITNQHRQTRNMGVIARLVPGATAAQANKELDAIAVRLEGLYPAENGGWRTSVLPLRDQMIARVRQVLLLVLGAVGFVLLITCVNVANLLLGRATARTGELAVRAALGAGAGRLRAQLLTESVLLALAGGTLGVILADRGVRLFLALEPSALPRAAEVAVDLRVLAFTLITSLAAGVAFSLAPGFRLTRASLVSMLRDTGTRGSLGSRRSDATRRVLIVTEVALSLILLTGAGLAVRSLWNLYAVDPGYTTSGVVAARVSLDDAAYRSNPAKVRYFEELTQRIGEVAGVTHVGVTTTTPLNPTGIDFNLPYHAEGQPELPEQQSPEVDYRIISPGYLEAMGIPVVQGRAFNTTDRAGTRNVLLVNATFARLHWPGENAIGKRVKIFYIRDLEWEVVGVVGDTRHVGLDQPVRPQFFVPLAQAEMVFGYMAIVVRANGNMAEIANRIRDAAATLDPNEPLYGLESIESLVARATLRERLAAFVFSLFAVLALVLSAAGIYGVISYQVTRRTREIGIRMALGAGRGRVTATVVGEAVALTAVGVVLGLAGALAGAHLSRSLLFEVSATDPVTFIGVAVILFGIAVLAALLPALRAAAVHPIAALRTD
jgi:putative ABC transport system permease protein